MPRTKNPYYAEVYSIGSLISRVGDPNTLYIEARMEDDRRVFIGFRAGKYAVEKSGKNVSEARRMRYLAKTLLSAADKLEKLPDNRPCQNCGVPMRYSPYTGKWHSVGGIECTAGYGTHRPREGLGKDTPLMYIMITVKVDTPDEATDILCLASNYGEVTSYDESPDGEVWVFSEDPVAESAK